MGGYYKQSEDGKWIVDEKSYEDMNVLIPFLRKYFGEDSAKSKIIDNVDWIIDILGKVRTTAVYQTGLPQTAEGIIDQTKRSL